MSNDFKKFQDKFLEALKIPKSFFYKEIKPNDKVDKEYQELLKTLVYKKKK